MGALTLTEVVFLAFYGLACFTASDAWHAWDEGRNYLPALLVCITFAVLATFFFVLGLAF
jgi:hypothetical protein